ncbi:hypothetical protein AC249_AIPGENE7040 [Exaiptasia diaphana]|nr:hypothetical protein AC249_AIPGENE7040 [Exaiptasia diaphana]
MVIRKSIGGNQVTSQPSSWYFKKGTSRVLLVCCLVCLSRKAFFSCLIVSLLVWFRSGTSSVVSLDGTEFLKMVLDGKNPALLVSFSTGRNASTSDRSSRRLFVILSKHWLST